MSHLIKHLSIKSLFFLLLFVFIFHLNSALTNNLSLSNSQTYLSPVLTKEKIIFASLPSTISQTQTSFQVADARSEIVRQYLKKYKSDLEPYSALIVELSDKYNFDYRWLVAIAQQESNLCKYIPEGSYNCWGWGIYGDKVTKFQSYAEALYTIAPKFKETFLKDEHLRDPYEVMQTYTPPSNGSWAEGVLQFFKELE
jgi:hypothetical protein